ncbi:GFA family protein [Pseudosulfitobacter sp. SM2401]|uniref:GFA family protein n=1 Tax=Pseudosulfitobacter sp. SM2401 TaxID=3350098 RepID=UPI0036F1BF72
MTKFTGICLCGSVKYTCEITPSLIMNCHCSDCRKAMGSIHGTTMFVPEETVKIDGYPRSYSHSSDSGSSMTKIFCETCGSQLFSKNSNRAGGIGIRAGSVDDASLIVPMMNIFTQSALPSTPLDPNLPQHRKMPG